MHNSLGEVLKTEALMITAAAARQIAPEPGAAVTNAIGFGQLAPSAGVIHLRGAVSAAKSGHQSFSDSAGGR